MDQKSKTIQNMFNNISKRYDLINRLLSFYQDKRWRKKAINLADINESHTVLDLTTGTGELIKGVLKKVVPKYIIGADFSVDMLNIAKEKISEEDFVAADAQHLPFKDELFDRILISFGFRNIMDKDLALKELHRVLKKDGKLIMLEFSQPRSRPLAAIYNLYFNNIFPFIGGVISGNSKAYAYLPASVYRFYKKDELYELIEKARFDNINFSELNFGIVTITTAIKAT